MEVAMRLTLQKPYPWLIVLLLSSSVLGWYLAMNHQHQYWLGFAGAWAGVSVGVLAVPLARLLYQPLTNLASWIRAFGTFLALFALLLVVKLLLSLAIPGTVGEAIGSITLFAFGVSSIFVLLESGQFTNQTTVSLIFGLTVIHGLQTLGIFRASSGIVGFIFEIALLVFINAVTYEFLMST